MSSIWEMQQSKIYAFDVTLDTNLYTVGYTPKEQLYRDELSILSSFLS